MLHDEGVLPLGWRLAQEVQLREQADRVVWGSPVLLRVRVLIEDVANVALQDSEDPALGVRPLRDRRVLGNHFLHHLVKPVEVTDSALVDVDGKANDLHPVQRLFPLSVILDGHDNWDKRPSGVREEEHLVLPANVNVPLTDARNVDVIDPRVVVLSATNEVDIEESGGRELLAVKYRQDPQRWRDERVDLRVNTFDQHDREVLDVVDLYARGTRIPSCHHDHDEVHVHDEGVPIDNQELVHALFHLLDRLVDDFVGALLEPWHLQELVPPHHGIDQYVILLLAHPDHPVDLLSSETLDLGERLPNRKHRRCWKQLTTRERYFGHLLSREIHPIFVFSISKKTDEQIKSCRPPSTSYEFHGNLGNTTRSL